MYEPGPGGAQIHDFNPGITQNGLFWTVILPPESVRVDLDAGTARLEAHDVHVKDYYNFPNSVLLDDQPTPAVVSFQVDWAAFGPVNNWNNAAQRFRGEFRDAIATIDWSATTPDYEFQSVPSSSSNFASEFGRESNGSFY